MPSFTKIAIKTAFLKMLNERPLSQITVKDIVEECGINRNSFYYHYQDIPTLVEEIIKEDMDRMVAEHAQTNSLEECLDVAIDFAIKNRKAALHMYNSTSREVFESYLDSMCAYALREYVEAAAPEIKVQDADKEILINFFKCECFGQIIDWLNSGMKYDIRSQYHRLCQLLDGSIERALLRSAEENKV